MREQTLACSENARGSGVSSQVPLPRGVMARPARAAFHRVSSRTRIIDPPVGIDRVCRNGRGTQVERSSVSQLMGCAMWPAVASLAARLPLVAQVSDARLTHP